MRTMRLLVLLAAFVASILAQAQPAQFGQCLPYLQAAVDNNSWPWAAIHRHNYYRCDAGYQGGSLMGDLQWNQDIYNGIQAHVNTCVYGHSSWDARPGQGENLAAFFPWDNSGAMYFGRAHDIMFKAVDLWGAEKQFFNFAYPGRAFPATCIGDWSQCGHYTQMVWRNTAWVGCAFAFCGVATAPSGWGPLLTQYNAPGWWNVGCRYAGPGNYQGQAVFEEADAEALRMSPFDEASLARTAQLPDFVTARTAWVLPAVVGLAVLVVAAAVAIAIVVRRRRNVSALDTELLTVETL